MSRRPALLCLLSPLVLGPACGDGSGEGLVAASYFEDSPVFLSATETACTLEDGTRTTCLELRFASNPVEGGPFCPETIDDIGGLGIYDGPSNPGFQVLGRELWEAMEADGYDIVDEDGNILIENPTTGAGGGPPASPVDPDQAMDPACLEALADDGLELRFLVPLAPVQAGSPSTIDSVELVGVSLDGAPMNGAPPSVVDNGGKIPALDPCGGHHDPAGYYHWHLGGPGVATVLDAYGITEVACEEVEQDDTALVGFAKDGYPLYGALESDGVLPTDLDDCQGHSAATPEFPDGVYHYHLHADLAPSFPGCLSGVAVDDGFGLEAP